MTTLLFLIIPITLLIFFIGLLGFWLFLFIKANQHLESTASKLGVALALLYLLWLGMIAINQQQTPAVNTSQMLALLAGLIWMGHSFVQWRIRQRILTVLPLVTVIALLSIALVLGMKVDSSPDKLREGGAIVHILFSMAAVTLLLGAGVFGMGQTLLHNQIKRRQFGAWFNYLPSLDDLDRLRRITLNTGWLLITVSMVGSLIWMLLYASPDGPVISHLHPMLTLWAIVTAVTATDKFHLIAVQKAAILTTILSLVVLALLIVSVLGIFRVEMA